MSQEKGVKECIFFQEPAGELFGSLFVGLWGYQRHEPVRSSVYACNKLNLSIYKKTFCAAPTSAERKITHHQGHSRLSELLYLISLPSDNRVLAPHTCWVDFHCFCVGVVWQCAHIHQATFTHLTKHACHFSLQVISERAADKKSYVRFPHPTVFIKNNYRFPLSKSSKLRNQTYAVYDANYKYKFKIHEKIYIKNNI